MATMGSSVDEGVPVSAAGGHDHELPGVGVLAELLRGDDTTQPNGFWLGVASRVLTQRAGVQDVLSESAPVGLRWVDGGPLVDASLHNDFRVRYGGRGQWGLDFVKAMPRDWNDEAAVAMMVRLYDEMLNVCHPRPGVSGPGMPAR